MPHRALYNDDIVREIVGNLSAEYHLKMKMNKKGFPTEDYLETLAAVSPELQGSKEALVACARVCKSFSEPALRGLWRKLETVTPLLSLFSTCKEGPQETSNQDSRDEPLEDSEDDDGDRQQGDRSGNEEDGKEDRGDGSEHGENDVEVVEGGDSDPDDEDEEHAGEDTDYPKNADKHSGRVLAIRGKISDKQWTRFQYHAMHIRALRVVEAPVNPAQFSKLFIRNRRQPLLPLLEELQWDLWCVTDWSMLAITSPSLRSLILYLTPAYTANWSAGRDTALESVLQSICSSAPQLQILSMFGLVRAVQWPAITQWKRLRKLQLVNRPHSGNNFIDFDGLRALSTMEQLIDLSINVKLPDASVIQAVEFPHLVRLTVFGSPEPSTRFLTTVSIPHLRTFRFQSWFSLVLPDVSQALFTMIANKFPLLRTIDFFDFICFQPEPTVLLTKLVEPLFVLHDLEDVSLLIASTSLPAVMSNGDFRLIGSAWPKLQRLWLCAPGRSGYRDSGFTAEGLPELFRLCPNLVLLDLPDVDFRTLPNQPSYPVLSDKLLRLNLRNRAIIVKDCMKSAKFVRDSFPNLDLAGMLMLDDSKFAINKLWQPVLGIAYTSKSAYLMAQCGWTGPLK
ncbi:hypothetical protein SCP_0302870 [Sparassis crispa]|uniref:Uncharacterized protein n=1 Tax=Sparassis crispa TaxID=139825 RepID=A0A401GEG4_9APHY|nr:hypothetical protein SCP_0302870 [Sparassis crispa]GBE80572.1 hypothetical protein SCP_0302870 [Sparassis crispa]